MQIILLRSVLLAALVYHIQPISALDTEFFQDTQDGHKDRIEDEEVQAVLRKYDIDGDGVLSQDELELGRAEIMEVMKQKVEQADKTQQSEQAKDEEKTSNDAQTNYVVITVVVGALVVVIVIATSRREKEATVSPEKDSLMQQRREAWLTKVSNQSAENVKVKTEKYKGPAHVRRVNNADGTSRQPTTEKNTNDSSTNKNVSKSTEEIVSGSQYKSEELQTTETDKSKSEEDTVNGTDEQSKEQDTASVATTDPVSCYEASKECTRTLPVSSNKTSLGSTQPVPHNLEEIKASKIVSSSEKEHSICNPAEQKKPEPNKNPEPTMDKDVLLDFLSKVLDCTITESVGTKTKYSLGSLTLLSRDVPLTVDDVPSCLGRILHCILPRQINNVRYSVRGFAACEEYTPTICDKLVSRASLWLEEYFAEIIITCLMKEAGKTDEEDLWSDYDSKHMATVTIDFLWRIAGWAEDGVFVSEGLLTRLLTCSKEQMAATKGDNPATNFLTALLQAAGQQLSNVKRMDEIILTEGKTLRSLEIVMSNPLVGTVVAEALKKEVCDAGNNLGNYYEKSSLFGPLLGVSTVPTKVMDKAKMAQTGNAFTSLRGFPRSTEADVKMVETSIQEGLHYCQNLVYSCLKKVVTSKSTREHGLTWIASVINLNELRTSALMQNDTQVEACCSDAYMLNFCSMLLEFFMPINSDVDKLLKVDLAYSTSEDCRLNYDFETCLAGGQIVSQSEGSEERQVESETAQSSHSFITECFHLCQRALSVGLVPSLLHYNRMQQEFRHKIVATQGTPHEEQFRNQHVLLTLMWDTCLCDEVLVQNVTRFYLSQAKLLLHLLDELGKSGDSEEERVREEKKAFMKIPEFCVKDMATWFKFVATHAVYVHRTVLNGLQISTFVDLCVSLLERPDLMPGPIPASKMVSCLLQFLNSGKSPHARGWGSGVMSDMAAMVETCPSVQNQLGPALLHTYISVDVVEGLDVDKDEFDKYSARSEIGKLIEHLWRRADCRTSIVEQCHSDLFLNFLGAILDTLLYMLHDSLSRLANIKKMETARQNEVEWNKLSMKEKMDKERFHNNEERVAKGFMEMANQTLEFIELLTRAEEVSRCFTRQPLAKRSASVICGFLDALCGSRAKDYKVKDFEKYNFSPQKLLLQITTTIIRVAREVTSTNDSFLVSMATDADFDASNLEKACTVISSKGLSDEDTLKQLDMLITQLKSLNQERQGGEKQTSSAEADVLQALDCVEKVDKEKVVNKYMQTMADSRFSTGEIIDSHSFQSNFQSLDPRSPKVKALMKEMKQLQQNLPIHPDASIFVVQDEERIDVMRAVLTGPAGTPYSLGCFVFDIYFPASYPNSAPLVKIITTGGGTVRFNPNLYSDGKVCLSLLGTWHGGDASEKWNPGKSSIYQVLVSIQSLILIPDPMYNEPGYEGIQGTAEGNRQSTTYNWKIRLNTLRHAILGQLRQPPAGVEEIVRRHLVVQRDCVLQQCRQWLAECQDEDDAKRLKQVVAKILAEYNKLEENRDQ